MKYTIISLAIAATLALDPFMVNRFEFNSKYFPEFSQIVDFDYSSEPGFYCKAKESIASGDILFELPYDKTYSSFQYFPFREQLLKHLNQIKFVSENTLQSNFLLSLRLLLNLKADFKLTYSLIKQDPLPSDTPKLVLNYVKDKSGFHNEYLKNLPLLDTHTQFLFSDEDIKHYRLTGNMHVYRDKFSKIYDELVLAVKKDTSLKKYVSHWLNLKNSGLFMTLYSFVISRSFSIDPEKTALLASRNTFSKEIAKYGAIIIVPMLDLCNHYHPVLEGKEGKIKSLDFKLDTENVIITSKSSFKQGEEVNYTYSSTLSNDFLLLNYGFIVENNPFQEFWLKFELGSAGDAYKRLEDAEFDMDTVLQIGDTVKAYFGLKKDIINTEIIKFLNIITEADTEKDVLLTYLRVLNQNIGEIREFMGEDMKLAVLEEQEPLEDYKERNKAYRQSVIKKFNLANLNILLSHSLLVKARLFALTSRKLV